MKSRRDANHREIEAFLRARGVQVKDTAAVGGGFPDLVCGYRGHTVLVELKTPTGRLLQSQEDFIAKWPAKIVVARNGDEAMIGILERCSGHLQE